MRDYRREIQALVPVLAAVLGRLDAARKSVVSVTESRRGSVGSPVLTGDRPES